MFESGVYLEKLEKMRKATGKAETIGLSNEVIESFLSDDRSLSEAIDQAYVNFENFDYDERNILALDEREAVRLLQKFYVNFYPDESVNPYIPLAASGPWIVSAYGAVLNDSGGYGMLGMGHAPKEILDSLSKPWPMANVMTPSFSQMQFAEKLKKELGHTVNNCPFTSFICMNSGSEAVTITSRIVDIHAKIQTEPDAKYHGNQIRTLALRDSFHGRTGFPAKLSHSTQNEYRKYLASFRNENNVDFIEINNEIELETVFNNADRNGIYYQAFYIEPVMGEGIPGQAVTRSFYNKARKLTSEHETLFIVDSIQAALRAQGCLSIIDYPDFVGCEAPDMETYSKALNAGQYPLSVVALCEKAASLYQTGVYGNTMTTNPRALEVGCVVLDSITDDLRTNIREKGKELLDKFTRLWELYPDAIVDVVGTGLMVSVLLNPDTYHIVGKNGFEKFLRTNGIEMIHGGPNGLRFTPHFNITSKEIDLIVSIVEKGLKFFMS